MRKILFFSSLATFCLLLANRDIAKFIDAENYLKYFNDAINGDDVNVETSFIFISKLCDYLGLGITSIFFIYSLLGIFLKVSFYVFKIPKYSHLIFLYFSSYFVVHDLVQIRVGAAIGVALWGIYFLSENKLLRAILLVIISCVIHLSVLPLVLFALIFFNIYKKKNKEIILYYLSLILFISAILIILNNVLNILSLNLLFKDILKSIYWIPLRYKENYLESDISIGFGKIAYTFFLGLISLFYLSNKNNCFFSYFRCSFGCVCLSNYCCYARLSGYRC